MKKNIKTRFLRVVIGIICLFWGREVSWADSSVSPGPVCCGICDTFNPQDETSFFQAHDCPEGVYSNPKLDKKALDIRKMNRPDSRNDEDHTRSLLTKSITMRSPNEGPGDLPKNLFEWG